LVTQLRRASISVCSNLAEGAARKSSKEKKRFYEISRASVVGIDTQVEISLVLGYVQKEQVTEIEKYGESVFGMLSKMIGNIESKTPIVPGI
jgi:four helix bundle protein